MWLICLHVVVCVCLYGLYRDDMSQGSTEYWVASSAVHPSKTLDFGHLERSHMAASASWAGRNDDDHCMSWVLKLQVASVIQIHCRNVPDSTLRNIETIHVWISASNLAGLVFHGFPVKRTADELPPPRFEAMTECVRAWPPDAAKHRGTQPQSPCRFDCEIMIVTICIYLLLHIHFGSCCWLKISKICNGKVPIKRADLQRHRRVVSLPPFNVMPRHQQSRSARCQLPTPGWCERASFCLTVHFCWKLILKPVAKLKRSLADHMQVSSRSAKFWTNFNQNKQKCDNVHHPSNSNAWLLSTKHPANSTSLHLLRLGCKIQTHQQIVTEATSNTLW